MPRYLSHTMIRPLILFCLLVVTSSLQAQVPDRASYKSPYSIKLSFDVKDLVGDLYQGKRADPKQQSSADYKDWYDAANQRRWTYWGPPSRHYPAPAGLNEKKAQWKRERVIAAGMTMVGKGYQHHHIQIGTRPLNGRVSRTRSAPSPRGSIAPTSWPLPTTSLSASSCQAPSALWVP